MESSTFFGAGTDRPNLMLREGEREREKGKNKRWRERENSKKSCFQKTFIYSFGGINFGEIVKVIFQIINRILFLSAGERGLKRRKNSSLQKGFRLFGRIQFHLGR